MEKTNFQYVWIKNWRCFENSEFNFSNKYKIHFSTNSNEITIIDNRINFVDNIYGNNIDITAIIGLNSSGKSSLLNHLLNHSFGNRELCDNLSECISIIEINEDDTTYLDIYYYKNTVYYKTRANANDLPKVININDLLVEKDPIFPYFLYCSDSFNSNRNLNLHGQDLLTPFSQMNDLIEKTYNKQKYEFSHLLETFMHESSKKQIDFILENEELIKDFGMVYPDNLILKFAINNSFINMNNNLYVLALKYILHSKESNYFKDVALSIISKYDDPIFQDNILEILFKLDSENDFSRSLFSIVESTIKNLDPMKSVNVNDWIDFVDIIHEIEYLNNILLRIDQGLYLFKTKSLKNEIKKEAIKKLLNISSMITPFDPIIEINWYLSSGEIAILNLMGNIFDVSKNSNGEYFVNKENFKYNDLVLLIDEGEVSLHPKWQRRFVKLIINFIKKFMPQTHCQIFFATHSPIILSDLPKQSTIFLELNEGKTLVIDSDTRKETFGSNIYDLFSSAYFMDDFIGEYSKEVISECSDDLCKMFRYLIGNKNNEISKEEYVHLQSKFEKNCKIVTLIGEPILKKELEKLITFIKENN